MAVSKILHMKDTGTSYHGQHLKRSIDYIMNPEKTQNGRLVGAINCQPSNAFEQMRETKRTFMKEDKRQGYHFIISFKENEVNPDVAYKVTEKFVKEYIGDRYEAVFVVHDNTDHIHSHIVMNSVSFVDGKKYRYEKGDWAKFIQPIVNRLCDEYGLSVIELEEEKSSKKSSEHYKEWNEIRDGKFVWSNMIKRDIDACILQASDYDSFIGLLTGKGYAIKEGKYLTVQPQGMKRFRRCDTLGENYSRDRIIERIAKEDLAYYQEMNQKEESRIIKCYVRRYKRTKLSGLQKKYYARLYKLGKLKKRPYSQAWKYREDIKKMHRLQQEYLFLNNHNITNVVELLAVISNMADKKKEAYKERGEALRSNDKFKKIFEIADKMTELSYAEEAYRNGDVYFESEHEAFEKLSEEIKDKGYSFDEAVALKEYYKRRIADTQAKASAVSKEYYLGDGILKEITENQEVDGIKEKDIQKEKIKGRDKLI